jgi:copper chaperone CopZ
MTCAGCARKVESTLKTLSADTLVTLEPPLASLSGTNLAEVNAALAKLGNYRAVLPDAMPAKSNRLAVYYPLFLIWGLIAVASAVSGDWMQNVMAGFFIVFGAFKLFDVPSFAQSYARYDVIAKVFKPWGLAYPFIETALGFAYLFSFHVPVLNWIALGLSLLGAVGVIQSVMRKEIIQCACLGTVFQLPMSTVTILENLGMAAMALMMIYMPMATMPM